MAEQKNEELVTIKIPVSRKDEGDVYVSLNGRKWLIKRGHEVKVPIGVAKIIQNSEACLERALAYEKKAQEGLNKM